MIVQYFQFSPLCCNLCPPYSTLWSFYHSWLIYFGSELTSTLLPSYLFSQVGCVTLRAPTEILVFKSVYHYLFFGYYYYSTSFHELRICYTLTIYTVANDPKSTIGGLTVGKLKIVPQPPGKIFFRKALCNKLCEFIEKLPWVCEISWVFGGNRYCDVSVAL